MGQEQSIDYNTLRLLRMYEDMTERMLPVDPRLSGGVNYAQPPGQDWSARSPSEVDMRIGGTVNPPPPPSPSPPSPWEQTQPGPDDPFSRGVPQEPNYESIYADLPKSPAALTSPEQIPIMKYTPQTRSSEEFQKLMDNYPRRYEPNMFRRITSGLAGFNERVTPEMQDRMRYREFYRGLEDWKNQIVPATSAMTQERLGNVSERMAVNQANMYNLGWKKAEDLRHYREASLRLQQLRFENPDLELYETPGGNLVLIDPSAFNKPGKPRVKDTGVSSGIYNDLEKANLDIKKIDIKAWYDLQRKMVPERVLIEQTTDERRDASAPDRAGNRYQNAISFLNQNPKVAAAGFIEIDQSTTPPTVRIAEHTPMEWIKYLEHVISAGTEQVGTSRDSRTFRGGSTPPAPTTPSIPKPTAPQTRDEINQPERRKIRVRWKTGPNKGQTGKIWEDMFDGNLFERLE